ncbi:VOC family protein [Cystobacter ferrugineus]|uniref:Glyoxalase n=1 Tax=Cystobacter ferrugineus TaxID=83449 RepID=A0A1L9AU95_9BACT|nr:VOC family protein [Cystobacter ferrugineus]OJH33579.1 glyoxalase [Cystobacter ferrugineus]
MSQPTPSAAAPTFYPMLRYKDAPAAIKWLAAAFGFEEHVVVPGPNDTVAHAELRFGTGIFMLGSQKDDIYGNAGMAPYVYVADIDAHCARARAAGAVIVREPYDTDHGSRDYAARDCEGHVWSFGTYRPAP